jgi:hypothetical protein
VDCRKTGWLAELTLRARKSLIVTIVGTSALTAVFFAGYFYIQTHPLRTAYEMPLTRIDLLVPFQPGLLIIYLSLWVYLGAGPGLQPNSAEIARYAGWISALGTIALLIFWAWPTRTPAFSTPTHFPGITTLHHVDMTGNACPSMHVAAAIFTALRVNYVFERTGAPLPARLFNGVWFVAIAYSTLAIRQHVVWDVVAGALLGTFFASASLRCQGRRD